MFFFFCCPLFELSLLVLSGGARRCARCLPPLRGAILLRRPLVDFVSLLARAPNVFTLISVRSHPGAGAG
jgi:hypothetical protein